MKSIEQLRAEIKARIIDIYNNVKEEDFIYSDGIVEGLLMVYTQLFDDVKDVDTFRQSILRKYISLFINV